jgi:hypothetical protein
VPAQPWPEEIISTADGFLLEHQRNIRMKTNCYGPKLIMALKPSYIQDIAALFNLGEAFLDLALIADH